MMENTAKLYFHLRPINLITCYDSETEPTCAEFSSYPTNIFFRLLGKRVWRDSIFEIKYFVKRVHVPWKRNIAWELTRVTSAHAHNNHDLPSLSTLMRAIIIPLDVSKPRASCHIVLKYGRWSSNNVEKYKILNQIKKLRHYAPRKLVVT